MINIEDPTSYLPLSLIIIAVFFMFVLIVVSTEDSRENKRSILLSVTGAIIIAYLLLFGRYISTKHDIDSAISKLNQMDAKYLEGKAVTYDNYEEIIKGYDAWYLPRYRQKVKLKRRKAFLKKYYETKSCAVMEDAYKEAYDLLVKAYGKPLSAPPKKEWVKFVLTAENNGVTFDNKVTKSIKIARCPHGEWDGESMVATTRSYHPYGDLIDEANQVIEKKKLKEKVEKANALLEKAISEAGT